MRILCSGHGRHCRCDVQVFAAAGFPDGEAFRQHVMRQLKDIVADLFRAAIGYPLGIYPLQNTFDMFGTYDIRSWFIITHLLHTIYGKAPGIH